NEVMSDTETSSRIPVTCAQFWEVCGSALGPCARKSTLALPVRKAGTKRVGYHSAECSRSNSATKCMSYQDRLAFCTKVLSPRERSDSHSLGSLQSQTELAGKNELALPHLQANVGIVRDQQVTIEVGIVNQG